MAGAIDGARHTADVGAELGMPLPLFALLSHALVAFTIEFDNEAERRIAHRTTNRPTVADAAGRPWLVSMAMWENCMRFVDAAGITVRELEREARTTANLAGMQRWGYLTIDGTHERATIRADSVLRATPAGLEARLVWQPLGALVEERWRERFGESEVERLRGSLSAVVASLDPTLPDCLPILGHGLWSFERPVPGRRTQAPAIAVPSVAPTALPALLARVLLAFAVAYETESGLSLAIAANVVGALDESGVRVRDLPARSGVSREAIAMAMGVLRTRALAVLGTDPDGGRSKLARLTHDGAQAQIAHGNRVAAIEERWRAGFGKGPTADLRGALEQIAGDRGSTSTALLAGLEPPPGGWRASVRRPDVLPQYPMVLHRGGFPDGS